MMTEGGNGSGGEKRQIGSDLIAILGGFLVIPLTLILRQSADYLEAKSSLRVALPVLFAVTISGVVAGLVRRKSSARQSQGEPLVAGLRVAFLATLAAVAASGLFQAADTLFGERKIYYALFSRRYYIGVVFAVLPAIFAGFAAYRLLCPPTEPTVEAINSPQTDAGRPRRRTLFVLSVFALICLGAPILAAHAKRNWLPDERDGPVAARPAPPTPRAPSP